MSFDSQDTISQMFDRIAKTYDRANRILSFGCDKNMRQKVSKYIPSQGQIKLLDVACGTADLLIALSQKNSRITRAVGVDLAENMLKIGQKKLFRLNLSEKVSLEKQDAAKMNFATGEFDVVTIAFGIRNVVAQEQALKEFSRVLNQQGRLIILEFSMPQQKLIKGLYQLYFRYLLPRVGGWISKDFAAYQYLNRSVEAFARPEEFKHTILRNGFKEIECEPLMGGIAHIYCARK